MLGGEEGKGDRRGREMEWELCSLLSDGHSMCWARPEMSLENGNSAQHSALSYSHQNISGDTHHGNHPHMQCLQMLSYAIQFHPHIKVV